MAQCPACRVPYGVSVETLDGVTTCELECPLCGKKRLIEMSEERQQADCEAEVMIPVGVTGAIPKRDDCTLCGKANTQYPRDTLCPSCRFEVAGRVHGVNGHHAYHPAVNPTLNAANIPPCERCGEPNTRGDYGMGLMRGLCVRCMCEAANSDDGDGMAARHLRDIIAE